MPDFFNLKNCNNSYSIRLWVIHITKYIIVLELGGAWSNLMSRTYPNEENCKLLASRKMKQKVNISGGLIQDRECRMWPVM